ncbi:glycosyl transferase family group 2-domain-containing protein [Butyriboletus roseoflavus]|nr:glycosyl transferase family group 2-domain-containing protein [Butyriboletus roseoflavus]
MAAIDYDPYDALLHHVYQQTQGEAWFRPAEEHIATGVCIRTETGQFRVFPYDTPLLGQFEAAVRLLNPVVAVKIRSAAVHAAFATIFENIIPLCLDLEEKMIKLVWRHRHIIARSETPTGSADVSTVPSVISNVNLTDRTAIEKLPGKERTNTKATSKQTSAWRWNWRVTPKTDEPPSSDPERDGAERKEPRQVRLYAPFYCGLAVALSIFFVGSGVAVLLAEWVLDGDYVRFSLVVTTPFLFSVALFFCLQLVGNLALVYVVLGNPPPVSAKVILRIGPVAQYHDNSRYYSAVRPKPNREVDDALPHITIELPVFKESLKETIAPSVTSIKKAMQTYARQGGTSSIFIHDDGLQIISEEQRQERMTFYANHNIGWVARPKHDGSPGGFKRAGRFKKASNMNYGLALSMKLEKHLKMLEDAVELGEMEEDMSQCLEDRAMEMAVEETFEENERKWRPWASNGKSLRIGEIILIVDADTIVPEDCLRDAAREFAECPDVAIIQHESGSTKCISVGCANGEVAPFVGHNAFLRWSAIQDAAFIDPADGKHKIWSESNVSEDFDMALRLQLKGYIIRWATYSKGGFKEGVSLTVDDELNRWQKYSYGCNELIFNPLIEWWRKGPISKQLRIFVWSGAPVHYKFTMMAYGIAAAAVLSLVNYLLLGFQTQVDGFFLHSFEVWLACTVVFPGLGNLGFTLLEYRLGHRSLLSSLTENLKWVPFFIHLSQALLAHLFSYNITWGATKKEVERSNFFLEVPKIWRRFRVALVMCILMAGTMVVLSTSVDVVPVGWQVDSTDWAVSLPLAIVVGCHVLFPVRRFHSASCVCPS